MVRRVRTAPIASMPTRNSWSGIPTAKLACACVTREGRVVNENGARSDQRRGSEARAVGWERRAGGREGEASKGVRQVRGQVVGFGVRSGYPRDEHHV